MTSKFLIDTSYGLNAELNIKTTLEAKFGPLVGTNKYDLFDFRNEKYIIEVKTRRINHNRYNSQVFGYNKFLEGLKQIKEGLTPVFVFNCTDGIYYWILDEKTGYRSYGN